MLPEIDPGTGLLPASVEPYPATLEEVRVLFVERAPFFQTERQIIFEALSLYAKLIWALVPDARLRIDGGFVTHKRWAAPADVDIAVVCPTITQAQLTATIDAPLFTLLDARGMLVGTLVKIPKVHVMGGLVDAFPILPNMPDTDAFFRGLWSCVTDENKQVVEGLKKGYVEVVNPNAY